MKTAISQETLFNTSQNFVSNMLGLGEFSSKHVPESLLHLVRLRVSQINGCCLCLHMHATEARQAGEAQARLDVLGAWKEAECFSTQERAALQWAEALTTLSLHAPEQPAYDALSEVFSQEQVIGLTAAIVEINGWNRISAGFGFKPDIALQQNEEANHA
ncbi:carboxymuconolactone decarboxylase family protein [Aestuariibacter sp. AA17]|uniref:Carboxymuconolactone decarboxylase family protein n=1 Tax=Fluctibacter corallii TaxID=2984329 RepID=A0ABT3ACH1_9ALTE|nr:carboxymuconolactone decarboxylase family protein [Aestuariibacter sp. AA17]MCV2886353.1 carboxymuconolactone decarboxylase family protein [Aestuariibacter sp. AA17]